MAGFAQQTSLNKDGDTLRAELVLYYDLSKAQIDQILAQVGHLDVTFLEPPKENPLKLKLILAQVTHDWNSERLEGGQRKPVVFLHEGKIFAVTEETSRDFVAMKAEAYDQIFSEATLQSNKLPPPELKDLYESLPSYFKGYVIKTSGGGKELETQQILLAADAFLIAQYIINISEAEGQKIDIELKDWINSIGKSDLISKVFLRSDNNFATMQATFLAKRYLVATLNKF